MTDKATIDIVKSKYIAISGTEIDVSGIIWATKQSNVIKKCYVIVWNLPKNKKTVWPRRMEIESVIFSPESTGR